MLKIRHVALIGSALGGSQLLLAGAALANPVSAAVTTGSASVVSSSSKTTIEQKSEDVVINWSSFNIGAGQTTQFVQPNAQAVAVNRIGGNSASQIWGTLDANGRIVLINGNGMLFGKGSQVNVGSLIATSTDGADSDVLSGKFTTAGNPNAAIVNQGRITAGQGGLVALVAPSVSNAGTVNAKFGTVAVGAANKFTVDFAGDGLVSFAAQGDVSSKATATNTGLLSGANVSLTAHAAEGVATGVVTMSGIVTAQTAKNVGGTILLDAGDGSLAMTGTLNAAGLTGGGAIETSGNQVAIFGTVTAGKNGNWKVDPENLTIDASAATTIDGALNSGTSVVEQTTSGAASGSGTQSPGAGDIIVASPLSWNTAATLTLDSYHSIDVDAPITVAGGGGLVFVTNDGGSGGDYFVRERRRHHLSRRSRPGRKLHLERHALHAPLQHERCAEHQCEQYDARRRLRACQSAQCLIRHGLGDRSAPMARARSKIPGRDSPASSPASTTRFRIFPSVCRRHLMWGCLDTPGPAQVSGISDWPMAAWSGGNYVGALVGENNSGTVADDYVSGLVSTQFDVGDAFVSVGGLVGYNDGLISGAYSTSTVSVADGNKLRTIYMSADSPVIRSNDRQFLCDRDRQRLCELQPSFMSPWAGLWALTTALFQATMLRASTRRRARQTGSKMLAAS